MVSLEAELLRRQERNFELQDKVARLEQEGEWLRASVPVGASRQVVEIMTLD